MGKGSTTIQAPAPPKYGETLKEALLGQIEVTPQLYASEAEWRPKFDVLDARQNAYFAQQAMDIAKSLYPQVAGMEAEYQKLNREAELGALKETLPRYQEAFNQLTPGYSEALSGMGQVAKQAAIDAQQKPELQNYLSQVQGPTSGQYVGAIEQYKAGSQLGDVGTPTEAGYLRGVRGPSMRSGLGQIDQNLVQQYVGAMPGMQEATQAAGQIAAQELQAGRNLSPEEERQAQQAARAAYAARGTALGPQSVSAEILNRSEVANQRLAQRMAVAGAAQQQVQAAYAPALQQALARQQGMAEYGLAAQGQLFQQQAARENLAQQIQQQRYAQAMGKEQLLGEAQAQAFGQALSKEELARQAQIQAFQQAGARQEADIQRLTAQTNIQGQRAQLAGSALAQLQAAQAPMLQAFYKQPILQSQANYAQQMGAQMGQTSGPKLFNPESPTAVGAIYGAYNTQANLAAAQAQINAGREAATKQMIGSMVGSAAHAAKTCWVAREIYGEANPEWLMFREWLITLAPKWLHDLYVKFGERFAGFIKNKPTIKKVIKKWMDSKIGILINS